MVGRLSDRGPSSFKSCTSRLLGNFIWHSSVIQASRRQGQGVGVQISEGTKIPINSDLSVYDVEKVSMAWRVCDHYLWISLNLLKWVLVTNGKNLKGSGLTPRGVRCVKKHPVSDLVLTAATIKTIKMLCHTACCTYVHKNVPRMVWAHLLGQL